MKKTIIPALVTVTAVLAACSKQTGGTCVPPLRDGEIAFGSKGITVTKSVTETTAAGIQTAGFKAAVVIDDGNAVMFNKAVAYNAGVYTVPGETYYYPVTGTISAYAAYPESETITLAGGVATLAYSQDAGEDLVTAKATGVSKQGTPVVLTFGHVLSQVSFKAQGKDANADYKLRLIEVTAPASGTYRYASNDWSDLGTATAYNAYTNAGAAVPTNAYQGYGESMTFVPGEVAIRAEWDCYNKVDGTLVATYDQSVTVTLAQDERATVKLLLPNSAAEEIQFTVAVNAWTDGGDITPDIEAAMALEAARTAALAAIDAAVDGSEDAGVLAAAAAARAAINAAETDAAVEEAKTAGLAAIATVKYPSLPGVFTVNGSGKTVKFAKGNLFWDGSNYAFEEHQYDYPTTRNADHIGHFYWSKDAAVARDILYNDGSKTKADVLFAADGGAVEGYTVLTNDEWQYLIDHNMQSKETVKIAGKTCSVLVPDGYAGSVASSYTAETWETAEAEGLVAIPHAGSYVGGVNDYAESIAYVWSASPSALGTSYAYVTHFDCYETASANSDNYRFSAYSVRLVQVQ